MDVAVIGGGIGGLSLALQLHGSGIDSAYTSVRRPTPRSAWD
jgi:2-polyprenyl-6-methoxyphenol hydroxylase-like FAD-dependent oxidoreductase